MLKRARLVGLVIIGFSPACIAAEAEITLGDNDPSDGIAVVLKIELSIPEALKSIAERTQIIGEAVAETMETNFPTNSTPSGTYSITVQVAIGSRNVRGNIVPYTGDRNQGDSWEEIIVGDTEDALEGNVSQLPSSVLLTFDGCSGYQNLFTGTFDTVNMDPGTIFEAEKRLGGSWISWYEGDESCLPSSTSNSEFEMRVRTISIYGPSSWVFKIEFGNCGGGNSW